MFNNRGCLGQQHETSAPIKHVIVAPQHPVTHINRWSAFEQGPVTRPLSTSGMYNCAALIVTSHGGEYHALFHMCNTKWTQEELLFRLKRLDFDYRYANYKVMPGITDHSANSTVPNLLNDLDNCGIGDVSFIHFPDEARHLLDGDYYHINNPLSVLSYNGEVSYFHRDTLQLEAGGIPLTPASTVYYD